jgi:predicted nuclease with TOPRIM domain
MIMSAKTEAIQANINYNSINTNNKIINNATPANALLTTSTNNAGVFNERSNQMTSLTNEATNLEETEKKIIAEFISLLDKSKQLFNGLRELPQYGHKSNQWQAYFGRTFDVYTKLWKFQQQHRSVLDQKYKLKRWEIGEIASKIGQLYYHY